MTDAAFDTRFERLIADLVEEQPAKAKLMALGEHSAVLWLGDHHALVFRYVPGTEDRLGEYLSDVTRKLRRGQLEIVLVGGQDESLRDILSRAQVRRSFRRQVGVMHLPDVGPAWFGSRTDTQGVLASSLSSLTDKDEPSQAVLRTRLAALVDPNADGSLDVAAFVRRLQGIRPWVTLGLLCVCILVFLLSLVWGSPTYPATLGRLGANIPRLVFEGQWQRLASAIFIHAGFVHLAMNAVGLYVLGGFLERLLGPWRVMILFGLSGLAGSLASACLSGAMSVGASGAIMGLFGASAVLAYYPGRLAIPTPVLDMLKRNTGMILLINLMISFLPRIDLWAHLGGGVCGALLMFGSRWLTQDPQPALKKEPKLRQPIWIVVVAIAIGLLLGVGSGWAMIQGKPWELVQNPDWERIELGKGVSIDVPKTILTSKQHTEEGYFIGNPSVDPLCVELLLLPHKQDLADSKEFEKIFEDYKAASMQQQQSDSAVKRLGDPQRVEIEAIPTIKDVFLYANGLEVFRFGQLRPGWFVRTSVFVWENGPSLWMDLVDRIPAGIRIDESVGGLGDGGR